MCNPADAGVGLGVIMEKEGAVGAESVCSWQRRHFYTGKRDWFEGILFLKVAVH